MISYINHQEFQPWQKLTNDTHVSKNRENTSPMNHSKPAPIVVVRPRRLADPRHNLVAKQLNNMKQTQPTISKTLDKNIG